ncbi:ribose-phosphate pyrophosphokinase [uncultured Cytophaga sp.]|uniref:ribose-phosphate pyrophosphokinase n=1 Tax=uncultured Cytophaga sp. TaxID=160238 RepID=UPI00261A4969|nr:ribose-phosphate pyrophosphokinase [uncultured Cytophaga sp.]
MSDLKLFSGTNSEYLAEKIAASYGQPLGNRTIKRFSDGEIYVSFDESVRGKDVYIIQSTFPNADNLMELMLMVDAARRASAAEVAAIIPYFGYARQDRKDKPRVPIAAKLVANLLSAAGVDRLMTCDLHAGQIQGFFDFPVDHLDGAAIFIPYLKTIQSDNLIIASPDVGGVKRAREFAKHLKADFVVCDKHRERANEIASMQLIGNVEGADVILVDDLIDTGGTITRAAEVIMGKGAKSVRAICTHAILSGAAYENIENSMLTEMLVTDTIPLRKATTKIKVLTVADLFAKAIHQIQQNESVSSLFL